MFLDRDNKTMLVPASIVFQVVSEKTLRKKELTKNLREIYKLRYKFTFVLFLSFKRYQK